MKITPKDIRIFIEKKNEEILLLKKKKFEIDVKIGELEQEKINIQLKKYENNTM